MRMSKIEQVSNGQEWIGYNGRQDVSTIWHGEMSQRRSIALEKDKSFSCM